MCLGQFSLEVRDLLVDGIELAIQHHCGRNDNSDQDRTDCGIFNQRAKNDAGIGRLPGFYRRFYTLSVRLMICHLISPKM